MTNQPTRQNSLKPTNIALIFAGGVGKRMHNPSHTPKQFLKINHIPILVHTLQNFQNSPLIDEIVVVMLTNYIDYTRELLDKYQLAKVTTVTPGGETGQASIYRGLKAIEAAHPDSNPIVFIHDGVRPIIEPDLIARNLKSVQQHGSAISAIPAYETEAIVNQTQITQLIDRSKAWIARAPQSFYFRDILAAHEAALKNHDFTLIDSCSIMQKYHPTPLHIVQTIPENIKITTPIDYHIARALITSSTPPQDGA